MRILFAGTPIFAERALCALVAAGHRIALVLTQPDRPAGRGMKLSESAVKRFARQQGLDVFQPPTLRDAAVLERLRAARPEAMVIAAYGLILPQVVLDLPRYGALNIHASLLPRWRGAAPIQRAILAGDTQTGITIMQMDAGLDTGAMLARRAVPIDPDDDAQMLHDRLGALGTRMIVEALRDIEAGKACATPQPAEGATYASKIDKREAELDWRTPGVELHRKVRAFNPVPGAHAALNGVVIKVWRARPVDMSGAPGTVLAAHPEGIVVACSDGALALTELQRAGGKRLPARRFLVGSAIRPGVRFDLPA